MKKILISPSKYLQGDGELYNQVACAEGDTMHNMPFKVTPEDVYSAILVADSLGGMA